MKIAINGFGRIGRIFFRQAFDKFDIIAINDLSDINNLAYLLKYDSVYGHYDKDVRVKNNKLIVSDKEVLVLMENDPVGLLWKDLDIDVVVEATGFFASSEGAKKHIAAGAKNVLITAPTKDETLIFTPGLQGEARGFSKGDEGIDKGAVIISNASCTTNAVNPVIAIMKETVGVKKALLNTIHAYTSTQAIVDGISKSSDYRRGRAGALNIVPSTTGAADATIRIMPELKGKFDGIAIRVPVVSGSIADITFLSARPTSAEEINNIFKEAAESPQWKGILKVVDEQIVSSDILKEPYGAIVDLTLTKVVDEDLVKVFSWYDNEWGYAAMLVKQLEKF